jgi:peptide/nickel transport system substrate-binding protein
MAILRNILVFISSLIFTLSPQKSYTHGFVGQPKSLLPNETVTENDKTVSQLLFRGLFKYDKEGDIVSDLADSYDISDDGLSYTVYLKKGQRWSNNQEITADDLLYSAFTSDSLKEIATDKIDRYTIRYTLPNKYSPFLSILTMGVTPSLHTNNKLEPISSGPYKVVRVKKEGPVIKEVVLQAIDRNFRIGKLSFRYYEDSNQLITSQKLGEVDGFVSNESIEWPNLNQTEYYQKDIYYSLIFNTKNKSVTKEIRKKLYEATPIDQISEERGLAANGPISESQYTSKTVKYPAYNESLTDKLNLKLKLVIPDTAEHKRTGEIIKESWRKLGVEVELVPTNVDSIEQDIVPARDFDVLLYGQEVSRDPDRYALWHSTRSQAPGLNLAGFENLRADRALEEGRNALVDDEREKHYEIFQESMIENLPAIFLYHPKLDLYTNKRVKVVSESNLYYAHDIFNEFEKWDIN